MKANSLKTLSVCMIVKNEEANLPRCLKSAQEIADEIIIVDTGSTDRTPEIVQAFNAQLISIPWENDFSFARNISLAAATCSWRLWLDADDALDADAISGIRRIKQEQRKLDTAFGFNIKSPKPGGLGESFLQVRMFPRDDKVRFERAVHEQITPSLKKAGYKIIYFPEIVITHSGYSNEKIRVEKALRNRNIILKDLKNFPDINYFAALGDSYFITGEWESGIKAYKDALAVPGARKKQAELFEHIHVMIIQGCRKLNNIEAARKWLYRGFEINPYKKEFYFLAAEIFYESGDMDRAKDFYERTMFARRVPMSTPIDNDALELKAAARIGRIYQAQGMYSEARRWFFKVWDRNKRFHEIPGDIGETYLAEGDFIEAANWFWKSIINFMGKDPRAYAGMAQVKEAGGDLAGAQVFRTKEKQLQAAASKSPDK